MGRCNETGDRRANERFEGNSRFALYRLDFTGTNANAGFTGTNANAGFTGSANYCAAMNGELAG